MRHATKKSRLPAFAGDRPNRDNLRVALFRLPLAAAFFFLSAVALAQAPKAIITGPKESATGDLIVLDASASEGLGRVWLLAIAPVPKSFLPVDSGVRCVFSTGTPGRYVFILVVSGVNPNGGPMVEMAKHEIVVTGGTVPTDPTDPPDDPSHPPNPNRKPTRVTFVWEKDLGQVPAGVQSALQAANAAGLAVASDFEQDTVNGSGTVPTQYRVALDAAKQAGIPALVVEFDSGPPRVVKGAKTAAEVQEAMKP